MLNFTFFISGDIFKYEVYQPWEFNSTFPLRSIVLPFVTYAPLFYLLRSVQGWVGESLNLINSYTLMVLPRLVVTALGGATDYVVFKTAGSESLLLYTTSYVTLVYYTRTLSNTTEAFLFTILLFLVVSDKKLQNMRCALKAVKKLTQEIKRAGEHTQDNTLNPTDDADCEVHTPLHQVALIAMVMVAGVFNRPTFLMFAFVPYVFWVFSSCGNAGHHIMMHTMDRLAHSSIMAVLFSFCFILCDSRYFGSLNANTLIDLQTNLGDIDTMIHAFKSLSITPLNFVLYNIRPQNLAEHGLHPRTNHFIVNAPLLFGMLSIFVFYSIGKTFEQTIGLIYSSQWAIVNKTGKFLMLSYLVPLILLSVFPHQEPRFLIPLLTPLAFLYGKRVFGWTSWVGWRTIWIISNLLAALFYGVLHQGGLVPCLAYLQKTLPASRTKMANDHIIFYHTYMPPRHLLTIPRHVATHDSRRTGLTEVHDLKGASFGQIGKVVETILGQKRATEVSNIYVVSPATLDKQFCDKNHRYSFKLERHFTRHLTMEDPPDLPSVVSCVGQISCNRPCNASFIDRLEKSFSLFLYRVNVEWTEHHYISGSLKY